MKPYLVSKTFDMDRLKDGDGKYLFTSDNLAMYVSSASPSVPTNNGIGVLADAISCSVKHQINGQDELVMVYPVDGQFFDQIEQRCVIVADVERRGNQPYRIYRITKPIKGRVTIYARHLAYDLAGIVVKPFTATGIQAALAGLKTNAMTHNPFTFTTTRATGSKFTVRVPSSIWSLMGGQEGSLLDVYGGEYSFDGYTISLHNQIGSDRGVSVRYGVNMTDFEQDENCANCYTGVVSYWSDMNGNNVVYSPVVASVGNFGYIKILTVDMSDKWEEKPTVEQLKNAAASYITANQIGVPKVSWTINFIPLETTEEYKHLEVLEQVNLGDTVGVKFKKMGVDATARVNQIEWDVLRDRYISVHLGSVRNNIADTISNQTTEIKKAPTTDGVKNIAAQVSKTLTSAIMGANGGSVRLIDTNGDGEPDEWYIADNPEPSLAQKVWRFNYAGWAASENGYNGPFVMGATLDDGLLADFVTAAHLTAGTIQSADGETFVLDLDGGAMQIGGNGIITSPDGNFVINLSTGILTTTVTAQYLASNYGSSDITRISNIVNGSITPTSDDYKKYDFYGKGTITLTDRVLCAAIVNTGNNLDITWTAKIDPASRNKTFSLHRVLAGAQTDSSDVFTAGLNGIAAANADINGIINCNALYINGQPVTP